VYETDSVRINHFVPLRERSTVGQNGDLVYVSDANDDEHCDDRNISYVDMCAPLGPPKSRLMQEHSVPVAEVGSDCALHCASSSSVDVSGGFPLENQLFLMLSAVVNCLTNDSITQHVQQSVLVGPKAMCTL